MTQKLPKRERGRMNVRKRGVSLPWISPNKPRTLKRQTLSAK